MQLQENAKHYPLLEISKFRIQVGPKILHHIQFDPHSNTNYLTMHASQLEMLVKNQDIIEASACSNELYSEITEQ